MVCTKSTYKELKLKEYKNIYEREEGTKSTYKELKQKLQEDHKGKEG